MLAFALMAIAALVVDLGFAMVTRRQMQTVADGAALEGVRFRDQIPQAWLSDPNNTQVRDAITNLCGPRPDPSSPTYAADLAAWTECARRWAASAAVTPALDPNYFNNNFNHDPTVAAPAVAVSGGLGGDIDAAALLSLTTPGVPDPALQPNVANQTLVNDERGDLVAGTYQGDPSDHAGTLMSNLSTDHTEGPTLANPERNNYHRGDFAASDPAVDPNPGNAFLARLRRTTTPVPRSDGTQDDDSVANVSSSGATLPYLFGRGSMIHRDDSSTSGYNPRAHGITVRATGIADAVPAMAVRQSFSVTDPSSGAVTTVAGVAPFALDRTFWTYWHQLPNPPDTTNYAQIFAQINEDGTITATPTTPPSPPTNPAAQVLGLTTLAAGIGATDTTITVASVKGFPMYDPNPNPAANSNPDVTPADFTIQEFQILVGDLTSAQNFATKRLNYEKMRVVGGFNSQRWTVTRGIDGTPATTHQPNETVALQFGKVIRRTFLAAAAGASDAAINVVSPIGFPVPVGTATTVPPGGLTIDPFQILVDTEQMMVTTVFSPTQWGVVRGSNNSTAAPHVVNAVVSQTDGGSFGQTTTYLAAMDPNRFVRLQWNQTPSTYPYPAPTSFNSVLPNLQTISNAPDVLRGNLSPSMTVTPPTEIYPPIYSRVEGSDGSWETIDAEWVVGYGLAGMQVMSPPNAPGSTQPTPGTPIPVILQRSDYSDPTIMRGHGGSSPPPASFVTPGLIPPWNTLAQPLGQFLAVTEVATAQGWNQNQINSHFQTLLQYRNNFSVPLKAPALVRSE
jgi:Putative Flp pilus-assembly TadE/G-like